MDTLNGGPGADMLDGGEDGGEKDNMVLNPAGADGAMIGRFYGRRILRRRNGRRNG